MTRLRACAALAVVLTTLVAVAAPHATAAVGPGDDAPAERVVIISIPTLTWDLVADEDPPALTGLLEQSAVASLSVRTIGADTSAGEGYATIGSGNRTAVYDDLAGLALPADATVHEEPALAVLARRSGRDVAGASVVHLGAPAIAALNDRLLYGAELGALGTALERAGAGAAVIANADLEPDVDPDTEADAARREAALALVDGAGRVPGGTVASELLETDQAAPLGVRLDPDAVLAALDDAAGAEVVLVELSDLLRADAFRAVAAAEPAREARREALAATDELLAMVLERVDLERDLVIVVAPTAPGGPAQLTVAAVAGPGVSPGLAESGTTRRPGYVTLPDIAPTVLRALDVEQPGVMNGAPVTGGSGAPPDAGTWDERALANELALFRNAVTGPLTVAFIALLVIALALAAAALTWRRPVLRSVAGALLLVALAVPLVTFLSGWVREDRLGVVGAIVATFAAAGLVAALAQAVGAAVATRRRPPTGRGATLPAALVPPLVILVPTGLLLFLDIAIGGPLQINTAFGYGGGAIVAGRFAGYGNLAWGLLAVAVVTSVTGMWGRWHLRGEPDEGRRRLALVAVAVVFVALTLAVGMPQLGQNVGGTLSVVPGAIIVVCMLAGIRLGWRRIALVGVATVGVLAVFAVADYARPPETRTHLGRLVAQTLGDQGVGGLTTVLERKVAANLSILTSSVWTVVIPAAIAFLAFLVWRPPGFLRRLLAELPGMRACLTGTLVIGVLAALVNDSGIAIPAVMLTLLLPYLGYVVLSTAPTGERAGAARPAAA